MSSASEQQVEARTLSVRRRASALFASIACSIALFAPAVNAGGAAHAATDGDWWYSAMGVAQAHDAGWTGAGVKVAVIDGQINPDSPGLAGANLTVVDAFLCSGTTAAVSDSLDLMSDNGKPVVTEEVTLVAPGIDVRVIGTDGDVTADGITRGTSFAAPLVSGALALAKEKYPEATGNQLIQALISTTVSAQNGVPRDTVGGYGYGVVSLQGLLSSEPLSLPDENPLMDKSWGEPTQAQIDAQRDGEGDATPTPSPEPKASEEPKPKPKPTSTASSSEPSTPDAPVPWPLIAGGGFAALGVAVIIISVMRFRRGAGQS